MQHNLSMKKTCVQSSMQSQSYDARHVSVSAIFPFIKHIMLCALPKIATALYFFTDLTKKHLNSGVRIIKSLLYFVLVWAIIKCRAAICKIIFVHYQQVIGFFNILDYCQRSLQFSILSISLQCQWHFTSRCLLDMRKSICTIIYNK